MKCLQCDSEDIVRNVEVFDQTAHGAGNLSIGIHRNPDAMLFKNTKLAKIKGNVCASCGYLMLSVSRMDAASLSKIKKQI